MHSRPRFVIATILALASFPLIAGSRGPVRAALDDAAPATVVIAADGTLRDAYGLALRTALPLERASSALLAEPGLLTTGHTPDLRFQTVTESLTGRHARFRQYVDGVEIVGGELTVSAAFDGTIRELHNRLAIEERGTATRALSESQAIARFRAVAPELAAGIQDVRYVGLNDDGVLRWTYRIVAYVRPMEPWASYIDASTGALVRREALFFTAQGRVFDPNPVDRLNDRSLRDHNDSASAVPSAAYSVVDLPDVTPNAPLSGPFVQIVDLALPNVPPADSSQSLLFDRSQSGFEDVNAYFHIDRCQRYLQSLGFVGNRGIVNRAIRIDTHAAGGNDDSFYSAIIPGQGDLFLGTGGTDDAEDADIMLHEFGHAIQDSIAPGVFLGAESSEGRALGEGFGDYWAFSSSNDGNVASGHDPYCIGDWDARCDGDDPTENCTYPAGADCLRRVDGTKTMADFLFTTSSTTPHRNGEIWSSALREIFETIVSRQGANAGRRTSDAMIIEATFGTPPVPTFSAMARKILQADVLLNGGANSVVICTAMTVRSILTPSGCDTAPRGELTIAQTTHQNLAIPDASANGISSTIEIADGRSIDRVYVAVDLQHTSRGDLRLLLTAPDGSTTTLQNPSNDPSKDIRVTYGLDAQPAQPLDVLHGRSAAGTWTLTVIDTRLDDAGTLRSWSLLIKYIGDERLTARPTSFPSHLHIAAVGRTAGAEGTYFVSDVRLFNRASTPASITAIYTPGGSDGSTVFNAVRITIQPKQTVALNDIVGQTFRSAGVGSLEVIGNTSELLVTSRTYNQALGKTFGQFIPATQTDEAATAFDGPFFIPQLQNTAGFRTNVGFAEVSGGSGMARVSIFDGRHNLLETHDYPLLPWSQTQVPILGGRTGVQQALARAEVQVVVGNARISAYASVVDNVSGDPIFIPARRSPQFPVTLDVPAVIYADGAGGTHWRTDLWLTNSGAPGTVTITFFPAAGGSPLTTTTALAAGETVASLNVLAAMGVASGATGHLMIAAPAGVIATTRTWTPGDSGTYGQFIPARPVTDGQSTSDAVPVRDMIQLDAGSLFRTNIGVAEVTGNAARVRFTLYDGGGAQRGQLIRDVAASGQMQFGLAELGATSIANGRVSLEVLSGSGRVLGYASVIDNVSGDPIYISAQ